MYSAINLDIIHSSIIVKLNKLKLLNIALVNKHNHYIIQLHVEVKLNTFVKL